MKPVDQMKHHPMVESLVNILSARTQNPDKKFGTIMVCYHLTKLASMMRTRVDAQGYGNLLVNFYGVNAAPSGYGKGHSTKIIEEQVTHLFRQSFMEHTHPAVTDKSLVDLAVKRAQRKGTDDQEELELVKAEFKKLGAYLTGFDSGTSPAIKQFRHQLLMSNIGSINFEVDEMGSNLVNNKEVIDVYLELYDGSVKPKLTKNTAESTRNEEIEGKTPTNMLMFGTPSSLLDGAMTERAFMDMLLTGYARRCFFGYSTIAVNKKKLTAKERLAMLTDTSTDVQLLNIAIQLEKLADPVNHNLVVKVPTKLIDKVLEYQMYCEELEESFKTSDEIRRAEARGRYYKTLRLAGTFAFLDSSSEMTLDHWEAAIKVAEMSAECFHEMLTTDPAHARLAKYLAECKEPVTHSDLMEELPFFPKAVGSQRDLIRLAIAYGHKHNIIIKRSVVDDIDFVQGEALQETNLSNLIASYAVNTFAGVSEGFVNTDKIPFDDLAKLTQLPNGHWCSHRFVDGIRRTTHVIQGFNMIVLDIDGTATLDQAKTVLQDYTYHMYTTKRHQVSEEGKPALDRFRIVLPMSHTLKLSPEEYTMFMNNVLEFLPFETDDQTTQANRKWLSNSQGKIFTNDGKLFDVLPFIPKTKKNEERKAFVDSNGSMDKLERYFFTKSEEGNRNNILFKFGAALIDAGYSVDDLVLKIKTFNTKLPKPLSEEELNNTVIQSVTRKYYARG